MKSLLDVSILVALIIEGHEFNQRANDWLSGKKLALCAISELGFLRVAALAYGVELSAAREALQQFKADHNPKFLSCDVSALQRRESPSAAKTTDFYLANLAEKYGMKCATLDTSVKHPTASFWGKHLIPAFSKQGLAFEQNLWLKEPKANGNLARLS